MAGGFSLSIAVAAQDARWDAAWSGHLPLFRRLLRRALRDSGVPAGRYAVSVVLCDDAAIRTMNKQWRGKDAATNVLSFPQTDFSAAQKSASSSSEAAGPAELGDIVIAYDTVAREAAENGLPLHHHVAHILVHGLLHLCGHDHDTDARADEMEALETALLAREDIPDPYA